MLSLSNAFGKKDMKDFYKKILNNFLNLKNQQIEIFSNLKLMVYPLT